MRGVGSQVLYACGPKWTVLRVCPHSAFSSVRLYHLNLNWEAVAAPTAFWSRAGSLGRRASPEGGCAVCTVTSEHYSHNTLSGSGGTRRLVALSNEYDAAEKAYAMLPGQTHANTIPWPCPLLRNAINLKE